ncbi:hypothetical protein H4582DRAFT_2105074 [Lactarius indigo]|nr:hypothetical protein H4582DRAFT_2105074 [Lactarius indigo]
MDTDMRDGYYRRGVSPGLGPRALFGLGGAVATPPMPVRNTTLVLSPPASPAHQPGVTSRGVASTSTTPPSSSSPILVMAVSRNTRPSARPCIWAGTVVWLIRQSQGRAARFRWESPLYTYPMTPPLASPSPLPSAPVPLHGPLVIPPYRSHDGRLWFPPAPPAYIGGPFYDQPPPHRPASAHPSTVMARIPPSGLPISGTPDHMLSSISHHQQQQQQQQHRSVSPPPAPSESPPLPPTQVEVEVLAPKPMPSPKLVSETLDVDPFAQSFGRVGTRTRSLSLVKLEEMAARAAAEMEAKAAGDKTLPALPVPSGKSLGLSELRRPSAQEVFGKLEPLEQEPEIGAERETEGSGLDALERRLVEQVGTRKYPPVPVVMADPPPARARVRVPVPGKGKGKATATAAAAEELENADEVLGGGGGVNESAISSLALSAEEDFGGRNANAGAIVLVGLDQQEGDGEDVEGDDADARTQRLSKGAGASSGSKRGTHKARSRKSVKSDWKDKEKKTKMKREVRDEEAAKGRVAEWLEKLAPPEPERGLVVADAEVGKEEDTRSPTLPEPAPEPTLTADPAPAPAQEPLAVVESNPNPRSSGFISIATLRRAPITLPAPESAPTAQSNVPPAAAARHVADKFPPPPQVEMKYDVKSARGGRGGRVTAVASIWAEATKAGGAKRQERPIYPKAGISATHQANQANDVIVAPGARAAKDDDARVFVSRGRSAAPAAPSPAKVEKEDAPPAAARVPRALFGLGVAAAATPSSPRALLVHRHPRPSTASLAQPPGARTRARVPSPTPPPAIAASPSPQPPPPSQQSQQSQPATAGWRTLLESGAGLKADLAFGQVRLRDLIRRYQGQPA